LGGLNIKKEDRPVLWAGLMVAILNVGLIIMEQYWALLIPVALLIVTMTFLALDKVLYFIIFSTPLSVFYLHPTLQVGFTMPTEPLLFGVMLIFFAKVVFKGNFDLNIVKHPVSLAILGMVFWMFVTTLTSQLPLISAKFFIARVWFVSVFFYLMSKMFESEKRTYLFFWLYLIPLALVVIYTVTIHAQWGLTKDASVWVMFPFFKEHTSYGAVLALYIPIAVAFTFFLNWDLNRKVLAGTILLILIAGVVLSYTRAAWLSLVGAGLVGFMIWIRLRKEVFFLMVAFFIGALFFFQDDITKKFENNDTTSSDNLSEHVESISNISTDASNMERINRWKSAFRMYAERPVFGHGPGTYMFLYAPYQKPHEKTIISTNAGDMGNAHSEYIGPLAESGTLGLVWILLIVYLSIRTGIRAYHAQDDPNMKVLALAALVGLITYWTHGFLNNFLDMDKATLPVWGFTAFLVYLDVYKRETRP
jgi:putative inorganic carbon (HCO3(-)) transporter